MSNSLQILAEHRQALLLAEVAAWLHDMGKCADEHIINQASDKPTNYSYRYKTAQSYRLPSGLPDIALLKETVSVKDLIENGMPRVIREASQPWLLRVLGRCHSVAHVEKELSDSDISTKQPKGDTRSSTAFGLESSAIKGLTAKLDALPFSSLQQRSKIVPRIQETFEFALGDTRRPVNEVTLADWSSAVAALYKPALAGALLGVQPDPDDLRWRLLRVNFDVLTLYAKAIKIADLMGYQNALEKACTAVKQLVEEKYPLGNEIYRDTTGIYFTFPDVDLPADLAQQIRRRVEDVEPELAPYIAVEAPTGSSATEQLTKMLAEGRQKALADLAQPLSQDNLSPCWRELWQNLPDGKWELCPVCRLRPMQEGAEACATCLGRRQSRIEWWQKKPQQTIWMDEIADHNDRVALIVGKFGLDDWLSGDLVQTMLVKAEQNNPGGCVPKKSSPARLRRVWETCRRFWTETVNGILQRHPYGDGSPLRCVRVAVVPHDTSGWQEKIPYDGTINGKAVSLLWQDDKKRFITISNLQLGVSQARDEAGLVAEWHNQTCTVDLPGRPGRQRTFKIQQVALLAGDPTSTYTSSLTLLESPDRFLALVPAADALDIAQKIEQAYRQQMGKVYNRLALFLGLVLFPRKSPLMAVMDTEQRMLNQVELEEEVWDVECVCPGSDGQTMYLRFSCGSHRLEFAVPLTMGDRQTEDLWYPYFFVNKFFDHTPDNRAHRFQLNSRWLVHARDLKPGDRVALTPSRFAYLFLESTAGRFRFDPQRDALLLDERQRLQDLWQAICTSPEMTDTKLQAIAALFEQKRQEWGLPFPTPQNPIADETFRHLVETTLKRDKVKIDVEDVLNGRFQRTVVLHLHILKRRVKDCKLGGSR